MTVVPFLNGRVFEQKDIQAMSTALNDLCAILGPVAEDKSDRELLAKKVILLAQGGERDASLLRDRILREIASGDGGWGERFVSAARHGALQAGAK
jgi:hypothetical protein